MDNHKHLIRQLRRDRAEFVVVERVLREEAVQCHLRVMRIDRCLAKVTH